MKQRTPVAGGVDGAGRIGHDRSRPPLVDGACAVRGPEQHKRAI